MTTPFTYLEPAGLADASRLARQEGAMLKAGGIDLLDEMKEGLVAPEKVVRLSALKGMDRIEVKNGKLRIGALVTLATVAAHKQVREHARILAAAAGQAATPQIRNAATVGGNLCQRPRCWYYRHEDFPCRKKGGDQCFAETGENRYHAIFAADGPCHIVHPSALGTALAALGGQILVFDGQKSRSVAVEQFFALPSVDVTRENVLQPGEIIEAVEIPSAKGKKSAYHKQRERLAADWPLAEVAVVYEVKNGAADGVRLVLGHAAPIPWRCPTAESYLSGKKIDAGAAAEAARLAMAAAAPLAQNEYKVPLFTVLIARALMAAEKGEPA
ncbi:FAD binding domain-containing protein [bacterium]|nr:FAD binding domain-containing protein [bacterium]